MPEQYIVCQLTEPDISDFIGWRYDAPYHIYNLDVENNVRCCDSVGLSISIGHFGPWKC